MVAYSFKARFAGPIEDGSKGQTIRNDRKRHARPGEELQLYTGMRTKSCRLVGRKTCVTVEPVEIDVQPEGIVSIVVAGREIGDMEAFARRDGFVDLRDMSAFWLAEHGVKRFSGVVISWSRERA